MENQKKLTKEDEYASSEFFLKTQGIIETPADPFVISNAKNILVISDLHFPFHDQRAIATAVEHRKDIDCIVILGDMLDFYSLSSFNKRPDMPGILDELHIGKSFLYYLREKHKKARIIFYEGNHEMRLDSYIMKQAPALFGTEYMNLSLRLDFDKLGIEYVRNGHLMKAGHLFLMHGNETGMKGGGVNVTRTMMLKTFDNTLFANFHRTQSSNAVSLAGKEFATFSIGCLCDLNPKYFPHGNQWNLGFADIEISGNEFEVLNKRILSNYNIR